MLTTVHNFAGTDGSGPNAGLFLGTDGNFYGTATGGGAYSQGSVFSITPAGVLSTLYNFAGVDGSSPTGPLVVGPDGNFYGTTTGGGANSDGSVFRMVVTPAFSTTSVSSSAVPSASGSSVTLTAAVQSLSGSGTPTGSVTFTDSGTTLGTASISGGSAAFATSSLSVGQNVITASYSGDSNFKVSSGIFLQPVNQSAATTQLVSSVNPSIYSQSVTFTASVTPPQGSPNATGTVTFADGTKTLGSVTLVSGSASITPTLLGAGTHSISAAYSGDGNYNPASATLSQIVNSAQTSTSVVSSLNPATSGQTVTFTASVTPVSATGTPTGTVTFTVSGTTLGVVTVAGGSASLTLSTLNAGTNAITAAYSGDSNFQTSSGGLSQVVIGSTTTSVSSSQNPSAYNQSVTISATVKPSAGSGTPTGTVTFTSGSTTLATKTLVGGLATLTTTPTTTGTEIISASYGGSASFQASTGTLSQVVNPASTTVAVTSSLNPSMIGKSVTFTATTTAQFGGSPTGTVSFSENGTVIASGVKITAGTATAATSFTTSGTYAITAVYSGSTNFSGATSPALNEQVTLLTTTTTVKSSKAVAFINNPVTFTATVTATKAIPNGEQVTFSYGTTPIGTGTTTSGVATLTTSSLPVGTLSVTAAYAGDSTLQPSTSAAITQYVTKNVTTTTLSSNLNPSAYAQSVTFTAKVTSAGPVPTGTVTFKNGTTAIGTGSLTAGAATFSTYLAVGTGAITASYSGDSFSATSVSATLSQVVNPAATTTTITSSKNPSTKGTSVTFVATVTASGVTPTGSVTFTFGSTTLGTVALASGKASLATATLPSGTDTITATFAASANFKGSSASLQQTVH